jgi:hypothetical protein
MSLMERYRSKESTPVRKETVSAWSGRTEVSYSCSKCMAVMVDMKCIHCAGKTLTEEEKAKMSEQMDALVKEYNELTGKSIKRFASIAIGQQRLDQAKFRKENPDMKPPKKEKAPKVKKVHNEKMSDSVRRSWDDEGVAKRRGQRHSAEVTGHGTHKSVWHAFKAIGLPLGRVIPFRKELKQKMKMDFEHNGKTYHFQLVPRAKKTKEATPA